MVWVWFGKPEEVFPPGTDIDVLLQVLNLAGHDSQQDASDRESFMAQIARLESSQA
ncbi:hypothetical protein DPSP01_001091 [Paraphaeosphaeria sporulosa]